VRGTHRLPSYIGTCVRRRLAKPVPNLRSKEGATCRELILQDRSRIDRGRCFSTYCRCRIGRKSRPRRSYGTDNVYIFRTAAISLYSSSRQTAVIATDRSLRPADRRCKTTSPISEMTDKSDQVPSLRHPIMTTSRAAASFKDAGATIIAHHKAKETSSRNSRTRARRSPTGGEATAAEPICSAAPRR